MTANIIASNQISNESIITLACTGHQVQQHSIIFYNIHFRFTLCDKVHQWVAAGQ
jgi:hypothetical protein